MAYSVEHLRLPTGDDLDILIIGKTGHGKSSTGNSILRREEFSAMEGFDSVNKECLVGYSKIDGRVLKVVDSPGFSDTNEFSEKDKNDLVINALTASLAQSPEGYHAIVLVISYIHRLNDTDRELIKCWIEMIGAEAFKTHGILVMSYGDCFERRYKDKLTVDQWWRTQSVRNQWLLDTCGGRCVLFHNITKDYIVSRRQLHQLVTTIDGLKTHNTPHIPKVCQFPDLPIEVYEEQRRQFVKIVSEDERNLTFAHLKMDVEGLKKELVLEENKKIYDCVQEDFQEIVEKLPELSNLSEFPGSEIAAKIQLAESTLYWEWVRKNIVKIAGGALLLLLGVGKFVFGHIS